MNLLETLRPCSAEWRTCSVNLGSAGCIDVDVYLCRGHLLTPCAVVTGGIHGDEYEGPTSIVEVTRRLRPSSMPGSVIAIPVANPLAFAAAQRMSPADGLNLARTFPGQAQGTATERLAFWIFENIVRNAQYLIDLHSGGIDYLFAPVIGFYGPCQIENPSFHAALHFGLPLLWQLPSTPGVLSREAGSAGLVSVGAEYMGAGQLSLEGVSDYARGVCSCLALWGISSDEKPVEVLSQVFAGDWMLATASGLFYSPLKPGANVAEGQVVAEIQDLRGCMLQRFCAPYSGCLLAIRSKAFINVGDWGALIGMPNRTLRDEYV